MVKVEDLIHRFAVAHIRPEGYHTVGLQNIFNIGSVIVTMLEVIHFRSTTIHNLPRQLGYACAISQKGTVYATVPECSNIVVSSQLIINFVNAG